VEAGQARERSTEFLQRAEDQQLDPYADDEDQDDAGEDQRDVRQRLPSWRYWPSPLPKSGDVAISSAAISERHENAQPCFKRQEAR